MSDEETVNIGIQEIKEKCFTTIQELCEKYKDDQYMLQRLNTRVVNYLSNELVYDNKRHERTQNRNTFLTTEKDVFIQVFLSQNKYYYVSANNSFFQYNNKNYSIIKEDDIIHKLLSTISKDRVLLDWKHKTKKHVISLIKERSLFNSIPETETIQNVLNVLYPSIFENKYEAKYFLTILGDNILKKNQNLIFLVSHSMKQLLNEIDKITNICIGNTNITNNFMTKYHENHLYTNCRILKINENFSFDFWKNIIKKTGLDLICVATHYSNRYANSDLFLDTKAEEELKNHAYYLKNISQIEIINQFCSKCLKNVPEGNNSKIEWKNLHFIWKQHLNALRLPNIIYSSSLKEILKGLYQHEEETDSFLNITSKYLPIERDFINFWEKNITIHNENINDELVINELELDEMCAIFKNWVKTSQEHVLSNGNISEEYILKIMKHFFPTVDIIDNKYILNISCLLWDKNADIMLSFDYIKNKIKESNCLPLISFDDVYNYYCHFCNENGNKFIVSKGYFEKYLYTKIADCIVFNKFIKIDTFSTFSTF
jgi:hypothetical protein